MIAGELIAGAVSQLGSPSSSGEFDALCADGCRRGILALLVSLLRHPEHLEGLWTSLVGSVEERRHVCGSLEKAAAALETIFANAGTDPETTAKFDAIGRIPPARLASELRLYSRILQLGSLLGEEMGVRSLEHFARFLLTIYVERATGTDHHANIAGIIADVCNRLAAARARGKRLGRPRRTLDIGRLAEMRAQGCSWRAISRELRVGVGTARDALARRSENPDETREKNP